MEDLQTRITAQLNEVSREQDSDTPDFILAEYLIACLDAFEVAVNRRDVWYDLKLDPANRKKLLRSVGKELNPPNPVSGLSLKLYKVTGK